MKSLLLLVSLLSAFSADAQRLLRTTPKIILEEQVSVPDTGSLVFVTNAFADHESARLTTLPDGFGDGEFTFEIYILADETAPTGTTGPQDSPTQLTRWSTDDSTIYSSAAWWYKGNFLHDGFNNNAAQSGSFGIQVYGNGRIRWTFGDGATELTNGTRPGNVHGVQGAVTASAPTILDGNPHMISTVRRWDGGSGAILDLYVDGVLVGTEDSSVRTNMATTYWDSWTGFPTSPNEQGWFIGAEKQAAVGVVNQYEDYKGRVGEMRFWNVARSQGEIAAADNAPIPTGISGLVGVYRLAEGTGTTSAAEGSGGNFTLVNGLNGQTVTWQSAIF